MSPDFAYTLGLVFLLAILFIIPLMARQSEKKDNR